MTEKRFVNLMSEKEMDDVDGMVNEKVEVKPFYMIEMMRLLSELETCIWDNHVRLDKVRMQNIIILLKSELIQIDKEDKDIVSVEGLRYQRVFK